MADEGRSDVGIKRIGRSKFLTLGSFPGKQFLHFHNCRRVSCGNDAVPPGVFPPDDLLLPYVLDEVERNPVCLVEEQCVLLYEGAGVLEAYRNFPGTYCSVPYPEIVNDASVLALRNLVVQIARMQEIFPAHVVGADDAGTVVHILIFQHAVGAGPVIFESEVPGREEVLCGEYMKLILSPFRIGEECSPVCQFGVRGLGVVHREIVRIVGPGLVRGVERDAFLAFPL